MSRQSPSRPARHTGSQRITLGILVVLALISVFLLPRIIDEPLIFNADEPAATPPPGPSTVAPSTAAELTKYRQDSQTVLAQIVAIRDRLLEQNVERWAEAEFNQAISLVEAGDEQYSFGEYRASLDAYREALEDFTALENLGQQKLQTALADGFGALETLNPVVANSASELAATIAPDDPRVRDLLARVATLEQLKPLIERGDKARSRGDLEAARAAYAKAVELDPDHQRARSALQDTRGELTEAEFRQHMSRGYAALERGDYAGARGAFGAARQVFPERAAIDQALAEVANRESHAAVSARIEKAVAHEAKEEWRAAVDMYQALLAEDPSLTQARVKLIPAQVRAELDERLQGFIDEPLSLANASGFGAGKAALEDARGIPNPGPRLTAQIEEMEELLKQAVSVVDVVFKSDNETLVTLFRVGELGRFEETSVRLRPGRYIAAGTRKGYRDVRVEFTVTGKPLEEPIVVRCEEPI